MPLESIAVSGGISWEFLLAQLPFVSRTQGVDQTATLEIDPNLAFWTNVLADTFTLNPTTAQTIDLGASFTNVNGEVATATKCLSMILLPQGGNVTIAPGPTNPFTWFFNNASGNATNGIKAFNNGMTLVSGDGADSAGQAITGVARTLVLNNADGSATVTGLYVFLLG